LHQRLVAFTTILILRQGSCGRCRRKFPGILRRSIQPRWTEYLGIWLPGGVPDVETANGEFCFARLIFSHIYQLSKILTLKQCWFI